jgi:hypothetical protein
LQLSEQYFILLCWDPQVGHILYCLTLLGLTVLLCVAAQELLQNFGLDVCIEHPKQGCISFVLCESLAQVVEQYF